MGSRFISNSSHPLDKLCRIVVNVTSCQIGSRVVGLWQTCMVCNQTSVQVGICTLCMCIRSGLYPPQVNRWSFIWWFDCWDGQLILKLAVKKYCWCPGWVKRTALPGWEGNISAEEGADCGTSYNCEVGDKLVRWLLFSPLVLFPPTSRDGDASRFVCVQYLALCWHEKF